MLVLLLLLLVRMFNVEAAADAAAPFAIAALRDFARGCICLDFVSRKNVHLEVDFRWS